MKKNCNYEMQHKKAVKQQYPYIYQLHEGSQSHYKWKLSDKIVKYDDNLEFTYVIDF